MLASTRFLPDGATPDIAEVNGEPAVVVRAGGRAVFVISIDIHEQQIAQIRVLGNLEKLRRLA